jgi:hypothetical protein
MKMILSTPKIISNNVSVKMLVSAAVVRSCSIKVFCFKKHKGAGTKLTRFV